MAIMFPLSAAAQPSTLYFGFSYLRDTPADLVNFERLNLFGWEMGYTVNIIPVFGITLDASGNYGPATATALVGGYRMPAAIGSAQTTYEQYTFLIGPNVVPLSSRYVSIGLHALAGGAVAATTLGRRSIPPPEASGTEGAFSAAVGGSIDIHLTNHVDYRLIQPEVVWTRFGITTQRDLRASTGIAVRFGR
jgi:hypothetical protein